jgi:tetratricopeptide (TPR) repeat protein
MTGTLGASAFVAALFALHPLHVESVAWVAERKDVLSTLWWVLAVAAYVDYLRAPRPWRYGWLGFCFALALMSKPMVVTLPFVLLLLDVWPLGRWRGAGDRPGSLGAVALVREKVPLLLMSAASAIVTYLAQHQAGAVQSLDAFPLGLRIAKIPIAYVQYLAGTIWPVDLAALYPYPLSIPWWRSAGAALLLLAVSVWVWRMVRSRPYLFTGWFWFLGTLVPVIGFIQAGSQPYADRFMYVPAIGLFVMAAWTVTEWTEARPDWRRPAAALAVVVVLASAVVTWRQVAHWKDSVTLWEHAVAVTGDNYRAQTNLGFALAEAGQPTRAIAAYREALRINPAYPNAHNYLGVALSRLGDHDQAAAAFEQALRLRPTFTEAHNNLGLSRAAQGRVEDAVNAFAEALRLDPTFVPARNNLAIAHASLGRYDRAIAEFERVVREQPRSAESRINLASALAAAGRPGDALRHFEEADRLGGDPVRVHHGWGGVLLELGDEAGAISHLAAALKGNPAFAPAVHDFGRALVTAGRLAEAIDALQSAVRLEPANAVYRYDFGAALARGGLKTEAIAQMRAALEIDPEHADARAALRALTGG